MKKTIIILSVLALTGFFTSCSGCAGKLKEFAKEQISKATAEQVETPQAINPDHRFVFTDCGMTYNEQPFMIGDSIHKMVEVFGQYDRVEKQNLTTLYYWDNIGIQMASYWYWDNKLNSDKIQTIRIRWHIDMKVDDYPADTDNPEII
jgi:hypothetical protein